MTNASVPERRQPGRQLDTFFKEQIEGLNRELRVIAERTEKVLQKQEEIGDQQNVLAATVYGDPKQDLVGLRDRIKALETLAKIIQDQQATDARERAQNKALLDARYRGIAIGLTLSTALGGTTLLTVLSQLLGWVK